jgi:hypothetical protein
VFFLFVDESGKSELSHPEKDFVLGAVLMHESSLCEICSAMSVIRKSNGLDEDVEFHASDVIGRKNRYRRLTLSIRLSILDSLLGLIANLYVRPLAVVVEKDALSESRDEIESYALEKLISMAAESIVAWPDLGQQAKNCMVFLDSIDSTNDRRIRRLLRPFLNGQSEVAFIESPIFVESRDHGPMQLADSIAFVARRAMRESDDASFFEGQLLTLHQGKVPLGLYMKEKRR